MTIRLHCVARQIAARMKTGLKIALSGLLMLFATAVSAAPVGYSVNSDEPLGDELYSINLANGKETLIGDVLSANTPRSDIEGMAFDRFNILWALDDESGKLFPINTETGRVFFDEEVPISGFADLSFNDFGMTFTCEGSLYVSTVAKLSAAPQSLYRLTLDGKAVMVGDPGALGVNISAIAAYGNPTRLYGLGNGMLSEDGPQDNRSLYEIDTVTGVARPIGKIGNAAADYFQAGLSFDEDGGLWAITDRRTFDNDLGSQILSLDPETGKATLVSTTTVTGFESLAVAPPSGCEDDPAYLHASHTNNVIPTLDWLGKTAAILALTLVGWLSLRRQVGRH
jgi:sugar lactone lactonase YvrE